MIEKTIKIAGKDVKFKSSAAIPRIYRAKFGRDIFKDLTKLENSYKQKASQGDDIPVDDLEVFENVAYVMAYHADDSIADTIEGWLDDFEMFSIYEVLPQILELWGQNMQTQVKSKKG